MRKAPPPTRTTEPIRDRRWRRRRGALASTLAALALLAAACGGRASGPGVARGQSTPSTTTGSLSPGGSQTSAIAYAVCMRSHGVPNFPDPNSQGQFDANLPHNAPQFPAAQKACQKLLPGGGQTTAGAPGLGPQQLAQLLKFAKCMRAHGVPEFPDPTSKGLTPGNGIDPNSPQFKAAQQACKSLLPTNGNGVQTTQGSGS